jgi:glutamyl-tRNA synthetase
MYNTRIAPSPTGDVHIGTARTAYHNWLAARASGGKFILRIDDTDTSRSKPEYVDVILETLKWLTLDYDEIIYQSSRFDTYKRVANLLLANGWAKEDNGGIILTLKTREGLPDHWIDEISGRIDITTDDIDKMEGMGLIKADGSPAYNFCSIVDDMLMDINYVIRGTDHISNTSKQVVIHKIIRDDYDGPIAGLPKFAHVGLIGVKGKPLSKREGAASMLHYRQAGYDPDAVLNFLARMGWGPKVDDKSTMTLPKERMLELFLTGGKLRNQMANLDMPKLESFDRKYKASKKVWRNKDVLM